MVYNFCFLVTLASYFITINDKLQFGVTTIVFAPYLLEVLEIMNQNKNGYLIYDNKNIFIIVNKFLFVYTLIISSLILTYNLNINLSLENKLILEETIKYGILVYPFKYGIEILYNIFGKTHHNYFIGDREMYIIFIILISILFAFISSNSLIKIKTQKLDLFLKIKMKI